MSDGKRCLRRHIVGPSAVWAQHDEVLNLRMRFDETNILAATWAGFRAIDLFDDSRLILPDPLFQLGAFCRQLWPIHLTAKPGLFLFMGSLRSGARIPAHAFILAVAT